MKDKTVIVIPFVLPWDRSADYQKQTCQELAKNHTVIAYMQKDAEFFLKALFTGTTSYPAYKNILFYRPVYMFPLRRIPVMETINQTVSYIFFQIFILRLRSIILWIFDPPFYSFVPLTRGITLYDCVDYHVGFQMGRKVIEIQKIEDRLIRCVDYFFVNSHALYDLHKSTRKPDAIVPQGFRLDDFQHPKQIHAQFPINTPIIGYIGAIDYRLDYRLLDELIKKNPQWHFVFLGPVSRPLSPSFYQSNVTIGFSKDQREIPSIIKQFDIGIIPFDTTLPGTRNSYPMKLFEYFYMGKPVIATPIEELFRFPKYVKNGSTTEEWQKNIVSFFSSPWPKSHQKAQRKLAVENSWKKKIEKMLQLTS